jgi:hypothetical protein
MNDDSMLAAGLESLAWLASIQRSKDGSFSPIGSNGFFVRGGPRASFDQQPVEASAMITACFEAGRVTGEPKWDVLGRRIFTWYLGQNDLQKQLYDPATGGCCDGLHADRVNENQGAESTISFLLALAEMHLADRGSITGQFSVRTAE